MSVRDLREWIRELDRAGELVRVRAEVDPHLEITEVADRAMLVRTLTMYPIECVVRGYLVGSGWAEYRQSGTVCGVPLASGLAEAEHSLSDALDCAARSVTSRSRHRELTVRGARRGRLLPARRFTRGDRH